MSARGRNHGRVRRVVLLCAGALLLAPTVAVAVLGDFASPGTSPEAVGHRPYDVAAGDLNGDGRTDLAVPNNGPNDFDPDDLSILLGDGTGNFTEAATSPEPQGPSPQAVAVANLDGDGDLDLAVANYTHTGPGTGEVRILRNNGSGDFTEPMTSPEIADNAPTAITAANLNGDAHPDLAVGNNLTHDISILLNDGDGDGDFTAAADVPSGTNPRQIVAADLNGDTKTDLAVANNNNSQPEGGTVAILIGDGMGGFTAAMGSPITVGVGPNGIAGANLDGDGDIDLAVPNWFDDNVTILLNNGMAGFTEPMSSPVSAGNEAARVVAANLNGDPHPDLAVSNYSAGTVTVLLNNGSGGFTPAATSPETSGGANAWAIIAPDLNGDGARDLAVANDVAMGTISILLNQPPPTVTAGDPQKAPTAKRKCKRKKKRAAASKRKKCKRKKRK